LRHLPITTEPLRIAIVGLGTVGTGVVRLLQDHADLVAQRAGRAIEIAAVCARNKKKKRDVSLARYRWVDDPLTLVHDESIGGIVELIGGAEGLAGDLVRQSLKAGKPIVTANKALMAHHGYELARLAEKSGAHLLYEAAVAGGIPVIKTLREGLAANENRAVYGILNGTCNYILSTMRETGQGFADVLKTAQKLGYAESDPAFDIEGIDAAHKLCLLSALAFGHRPAFHQVSVTGIARIGAKDIEYAGELGFRVKLLGIARRVNGHITQKVEPCLVPSDSTMGAVEGVFNAVYIDSDFADRSLSMGRGAGERPTASAVVADLIDLAWGWPQPVFGMACDKLEKPVKMPPGTMESAYYMRMTAIDKPGVLADCAAILRDHGISVESVLQRGRDPGKPISIVMITHPAKDTAMAGAARTLAKLKCMAEAPCVLRIESFDAG
jgi:homoserine dehydrogenase